MRVCRDDTLALLTFAALLAYGFGAFGRLSSANTWPNAQSGSTLWLATTLLAILAALLGRRLFRIKVGRPATGSPLRNALGLIALVYVVTVGLSLYGLWEAGYMLDDGHDLWSHFAGPWQELALQFIAMCAAFAFYLFTVRATPPGVVWERAVAAIALGTALASVFLSSFEFRRLLESATVGADVQRLDDVAAAWLAVHTYWRANGALPRTLLELQDPRAQDQVLRDFGEALDPVTRKPLSYAPADGSRFTICSKFDGPSALSAVSMLHHASGNVCFHFDAKPSPAIAVAN